MIRRPALVLFAALLSACSLQPLRPDVADPEAAREVRDSEIAALSVWHLSGRYLITDAVEVWSGTLDWQQAPEKYVLLIKGPLGQGGVRVTGRGQQVELEGSDGSQLRTDDVERLLREQFGWAIPVNALRYWVLGTTAPGIASSDLQFDEAGRPSRFTQDGWAVEYPAYQRQAALDLPRRLFIRRGDNQLKLVIGSWRFGES